MPALFGEIRQIAFVSKNIDESIRRFVDAWNIGPWHVMRHMKGNILYKGQPSELDLSIALSNCGEMQFEIIEQHNEAPSVYRDFLSAMESGLPIQHIAVWADDFSKTKADALRKGWAPVLETRPGPGQACYVVHPSDPMVCVEISDRSPQKEQVRAAVRESARNWDGADPIREGLSLK